MNLSIFFHWHKLLHFILPVIIILAFQKKFGLLRICIAVFIAGLFKEIYDTIIIMDPLLISIMDTAANAVGIIIGVTAVEVKKLISLNP